MALHLNFSLQKLVNKELEMEIDDEFVGINTHSFETSSKTVNLLVHGNLVVKSS